MLNIEITETKNFVKKLLMEPVFDTFLLVEAYVRSDVSYTIDGRLNPSFFDTEELEEMTSKTYTTWGAVRHHIFNVIKGNKLPLNFKLVLILSDANINRIIEQNHLNLTASDIANFAMSFVGYSYVWGGTSPSTGFDCSGLMYYVLTQYGYSMKRVANDQMTQGTAVS